MQTFDNIADAMQALGADAYQSRINGLFVVLTCKGLFVATLVRDAASGVYVAKQS